MQITRIIKWLSQLCQPEENNINRLIKASSWPHRQHVQDGICPFAIRLLWCELKIIKKLPLRLLVTDWAQQPSRSTQRSYRSASKGSQARVARFCLFSLRLCWHRSTSRMHLPFLKAKHQTSLCAEEWMKQLNKWGQDQTISKACLVFVCLLPHTHFFFFF